MSYFNNPWGNPATFGGNGLSPNSQSTTGWTQTNAVNQSVLGQPQPSISSPQPQTTREFLEAAWNKQHPYGGEVKMTGPLGDISYYDPDLNRPKEPAAATPSLPTSSVAAPEQSEPYREPHVPSEWEKQQSQDSLVDFIKDQERIKTFPYLDSKEKITVGYGHMDETPQSFAQHPFFNRYTQQPYSPQEKLAEYDRINSLPQNNFKADYYKKLTDFRVSPEYVNELLMNDLQVRRKELAENMPNFNRMSPSMQNAVMETHYNANVLSKDTDGIHKWPKLLNAAQGMKQEEFCKNLHREEKGRPDLISRNNWALEQCRKGYFY